MSGQTTVVVNVTIDDTLRFTQLQPYTAIIDESVLVDSPVTTVAATPQVSPRSLVTFTYCTLNVSHMEWPACPHNYLGTIMIVEKNLMTVKYVFLFRSPKLR